MFSRFFIHRPIFASVLSIAIVVAGAVSVMVLPVAQFPNIAPPTVTVNTSYPGANGWSSRRPSPPRSSRRSTGSRA